MSNPIEGWIADLRAFEVGVPHALHRRVAGKIATALEQARERLTELEAIVASLEIESNDRLTTIQELRAECERMRRTFGHYHKQAEDLNDSQCQQCGLDLRDPVHSADAILGGKGE